MPRAPHMGLLLLSEEGPRIQSSLSRDLRARVLWGDGNRRLFESHQKAVEAVLNKPLAHDQRILDVGAKDLVDLIEAAHLLQTSFCPWTFNPPKPQPERP